MCKQVHNPLYVLSAFHVFLPPLSALFSWQRLRTPQSQKLKQDTIWNRHALLIPTRLFGLLEWGTLPALFHSEGLEGQACHYECTTAYMTLHLTNAKVSASPRQLPEMKATQAICGTNENIYLLIFSVVYSTTRHTLLIRQSRRRALNSDNNNTIAPISINHSLCVGKILVHASYSV